MKVLVLGSQGQLGRCLTDQFNRAGFSVSYATRKEIDLSNLHHTKMAILDLSPDVIINAAAFAAVDQAETDMEEAFLINDTAVANLAQISKQAGIWFIHISTDYVFDGLSKGPYKETDPTNPQSVYGKSKLSGEAAIQRVGCKFLIIRTAWLFSEYGSNFVKTMFRLAETHNEVKVVNDQFGCPTYAHDLAKAIICTLPFLGGGLDSGIFHFTGFPRCSWAEFAQSIFNEIKSQRILTKSPKVIPISSAEYLTAAARPANSQLDTSLFESKFQYKSPDWSNGISKTIKWWGDQKLA